MIHFGIMYSMEWSHGAELWSGVESNFGVAKIRITPADSVYLTFSGQDIDSKHLLQYI